MDMDVRGGALWVLAFCTALPTWAQWAPEPPVYGEPAQGQWGAPAYPAMAYPYAVAPNALQPGAPPSFMQYEYGAGYPGVGVGGGGGMAPPGYPASPGAAPGPGPAAGPASASAFRFRAAAAARKGGNEEADEEDEDSGEQSDSMEDDEDYPDSSDSATDSAAFTPEAADEREGADGGGGSKSSKKAKVDPALTTAFVTVATNGDDEVATAPAAGEGGEEAAPAGDKDPLDVPYEDVKQQIIAASKKVAEEGKWVQQVNDVMEKYRQKVDNVQKDMDDIRQNIKTLLIKKRQIQNLKLQKQLSDKLEDANADMETLDTALTHVQTKQENFVDTKGSLQDTIAGLQKALNTLKGEPLPEEAHVDKSETLSEAMIETHEAHMEASAREKRVEAELA